MTSNSSKLYRDVYIGDFSIIGPNVEIGSGTVIEHHVVISGNTKIGKNNHIGAFSVIGGDAREFEYENYSFDVIDDSVRNITDNKEQECNLIIGDNNIVREFCSISPGDSNESPFTIIGSNNILMPFTAIAHDCRIGNHVITSNNASIAAHSIVDDWVIIGGFTVIKRFCEIKEHSYIGMGCHIYKNITKHTNIKRKQ